MQSIQALKNAVVVLSKHHSDDALLSVKQIIQHHLGAKILVGTISPTQHRTLAAFLQQPAGFQSYAPQSGQIFGILKQMKETFESNLSSSQKDELQAAEDFANLKAAKTTEMEKAQAMVDSKTQELADTVETNEAAKQNKVDTEAALAADTKFLEDLKVRCKNADAEFEERTKARAEELQAVAETIALLNSDEAHEMFGKTLGLLQLSSKARRANNRRTKAAAALRKTAAKTGSQELVALAATVQIAGFEQVKEAISTMIDELKVQQKDEVVHRDWCIEEFAENKKQTVLNQDTMTDLQAKIAELTDTIDTLTKELADHQAEVDETKLQMKRAGEDREAENAEFQETVADQRAAQQILTMALNRMKQTYGLMQSEPGEAAPPPPEGFKEYKQNEGGGGVVGMIQEIIDESKTMEMDALKAEGDSQAAYESFTKNGNASIKALMQAITDKTEKKATADADLVYSKESLMKTMKALEALKGTLHASCDFVLDNFDTRQEKRADEIEALRQAMDILSGAK